jgi:hypothetical protein
LLGIIVMETHARPGIEIDRLLTADHDRLEKLFGELLDSYESGDWDVVRPLWCRLETAVRNHMAAEEQYVLPEFELYDPGEARALRRAHARLRAELAELAIGVDLHMVNLPMARAFVRELRAHAHREDALLYAWAREHLDRSACEAIEARLASEPTPTLRTGTAPARRVA